MSRSHDIGGVPPRGKVARRVFAARVALATAAALVLLGTCAAAWPGLAAAKPEATRTIKIKLLDRLVHAPQLLVLGSSRAMRVNPALLRRLTGLHGFNAAVSSGSCADAWCFLHLDADKFPSTTPPRIVWVLDVEQFRAHAIHPWLLSVPRLAQYIPPQFLPSSTRQASSPGSRSTLYDANGFLRHAYLDNKVARGWTLAQGVADSIKKYRAIYPAGFRSLPSMPKWFVQQSILLLNAEGVRPVIVLSPYQPRLLQFIKGRNWTNRHQQVLDFFDSLRPNCDFVLLDMTRLNSFHGWASGFYDGTHEHVALLNRLVRVMVRESDSALTVPATP